MLPIIPKVERVDAIISRYLYFTCQYIKRRYCLFIIGFLHVIIEVGAKCSFLTLIKGAYFVSLL